MSVPHGTDTFLYMAGLAVIVSSVGDDRESPARTAPHELHGRRAAAPRRGGHPSRDPVARDGRPSSPRALV
jgi:hypothetical protein